MDTKKWLKMVEHEAKTKINGGWLTDTSTGKTYDIEMSQAIGDQWFFGFANSDLEKVIPNFDLDSALFAVANDCLVRLMLVFDDEEMIRDLVEQSILSACKINNKDNKT